MSLINITDLSFAYEGSYQDIFSHVSFQIDTDWKLGFIGRNGRGKTTFLKLLMGEYEYQGSITSSVQFEYFPYEVREQERSTLDILSDIFPGFELWRLVKELKLMEVPEEVLYRSFHTLSNGEQTKVMLAVLFVRENQFLLIDEPTNHLDMAARRQVAGYLKRKKGFILVSHDRHFLDLVVDHVLSINKTDIEVRKGDFSTWYANKEARDRWEYAQNEKLKSEVKRLEKAARQPEGWSDKVEKSKRGQTVAGLRPDRGHIGHQAAKMMKRSKIMENRQQKALEEKSKLLKNIDSADRLKLFPLFYHAHTIAEFKKVSVFYGDYKVINEMSFSVCRGDRVCLSGRNGCGKTSILKLMMGEDIRHSGQVHVGTGVKISYVSQDVSWLYGDIKSLAVRYGLDETLFKTMLRKLDLEREQFDKDTSQYSAGQKKKVLLAKSLCEQAHLYIWDEPLNYIDVLSRVQIEDLILEYGPSMVFVEHDEAFRDRVANKVIEFGTGFF